MRNVPLCAESAFEYLHGVVMDGFVCHGCGCESLFASTCALVSHATIMHSAGEHYKLGLVCACPGSIRHGLLFHVARELANISIVQRTTDS